MIYTVYKITNTLDSRFYIGVHKTDNPTMSEEAKFKLSLTRTGKTYGKHKER